MQAIAIRPQRRQIMALVYGVAACSVGMAVFPALCLPLGLCLPLFACPLVGTARQWAAIAAGFAAPIISLISGAPSLYSLSLLFSCGAPVALAFVLAAKKRTGNEAIAYYVAAYVFSLVLTLLSVRDMLDGGARGLADLIVEGLMASPDANLLLYRLAAAGLVSVPSAYQGASQLSFMLDPVLLRQMALSLRLTVQIYVEQLLPSMLVQVCLLGGVFTALRTQRLHHSYLLVDEQHREQVKMAVIPGFSALTLPPRASTVLLVMAVSSLVLVSMEGSWFHTLAQLLFAAFEGVYELLGAAALVGMLLKKRPESRVAYGMLAAAMYLLVPLALLMLGIMDGMMHFRTRDPFHKKEEDEQ